jgi:putative Holliday junction resolvase
MNLSGGTLLAFDFGLKRIGVAVGNTVTRNASPHKIIHAPTNDGKFAEIAALISEWQPFVWSLVCRAIRMVPNMK